MRILATIPHYYRPDGDQRYGSLKADPAPRIAALRRTIQALHAIAGPSQGYLYPPERRVVPANEATSHHLDVAICTTGDHHLLDRLDLPGSLVRQIPSEVEPMRLGFECHAALKAGLGRYDYFCFLEDDIVVEDPWFFVKLAWFSGWAGTNRLLQPNRYEFSPKTPIRKIYIDGDIAPKHTARYQSLSELPELMTRCMGLTARFRASSNPHSGCFFLNQAQMKNWSEKDYFLDRDTGFMGPLESAATLGVLRCFDIYKPAPECAQFLEVLHADNRYLGNRLKFAANRPAAANPNP